MPPERSDASDPYADYVEHPRFGRGPRITGLNPDALSANVNLIPRDYERGEIGARYALAFSWFARLRRRLFKTNLERWVDEVDAFRCSHRPEGWRFRIPNTAIKADLSRQTPATVPATHYFDVERRCVDCERLFIFFAEEQKYWYEQLGFKLNSDAVRCVPCRKQQRDNKHNANGD